MTIIKNVGCRTSHETYITFHGLKEAIELINQHQNDDHVVIFLDHLWEVNLIDSIDRIEKFVNLIRKKRPSWKIFAKLNSANQPLINSINRLDINDVLFVDFFLYRVYNEVVVHKKSSFLQPTQSTDYDKNKFLFLTGKAHKYHRIGLLRKFIDTGLIKSAEWSLFYFTENKLINERTRQLLPDLGDDEFDEFMRTWSRNPDNIDVATTLNTKAPGFEYCGIPYDVRLYRDTDFSVISETTFKNSTIDRNFENINNPWITEKIWIPILNKHPFIIAGDVDILHKLEQLGFDTFREFLKIPDYDKITDPDIRLDAVVQNTAYFLQNLNKNKQLINQLTIKNSRCFDKMATENSKKIVDFMEKHDLLECSMDDIVSTKDRHDDYQIRKTQDRHFAKFYNDIKDSSWPDCSTVDQFFQLPTHIRDECTNIFGYIPPDH
jgi:hypothetical protein